MNKLIAYIVVIGLCICGISTAWADWTDNFDGAEFDVRWGEDEPNSALGDVSLDTVNSNAHFTATASINMWSARDNAPILWTAAPAGNYSFETHVAMGMGQDGAQAGIVVYSADGSIPNFIFCLDHWSSTHVIKFQGVGDNNPNVLVSATGGEAWLRLKVVRNAGIGNVDYYEAQYKLNVGDAWTTLHTYEIDTADLRVGLVFKTGGGGKTADFSYAKMTEIPTTFTDNFDEDVFDIRWSEDEPNPALGNVTLDTVNSNAHFASAGNLNMWTTRQDAPILWASAPEGNYYIETHVSMSTLTNRVQAGITVYTGDGTLPGYILHLDHWATQRIAFTGLGNATPNVTFNTTAGEAWLRLAVLRDGGTSGLDRYISQYKLSSEAPWTTLTTFDKDTPNARVGLFLKAESAGRAADFSYAEIGEWNGIEDGDVIKLDFSTAGDGDGGSVADWNQVGATSPDIAMGGVIRHGDTATVHEVAILFENFVNDRVNNEANAANWGGTGADPYYILAADDMYFHGTADDLSVTFSGLPTNMVYNVRIYSLIGSAAGSIERFVVTDGTGTRSVENTRGARWGAATLSAGGTVIARVNPNPSGEIKVTVEDVSSIYYPLNAIVLEAKMPRQGTIILVY